MTTLSTLPHTSHLHQIYQSIPKLKTSYEYLNLPNPAQFDLTPPTSLPPLKTALSALALLPTVRSKLIKASISDNLTDTLHYLSRINLDISKTQFVHVAGSKGKGSTSTYVENILFHAGYKTGLYTSPHLVSVTERFRVNSKSVEEDTFLRAFWTIWDRIITSIGDVPITSHDGVDKFAFLPLPPYFSMLTLTAFFLFQLENVDIVVCEVGLGGRFCSTNVITPLITAITTLSLEHTEILGNTLDKIAWMKCGIFKPNIPIVVFPQKVQAWEVILEESKKVNQFPILISPYDQYKGVKLGIAGDYQPQNSNLALILASYAISMLLKKDIFPQNCSNLNFLNSFSLCEMYKNIKHDFVIASASTCTIPNSQTHSPTVLSRHGSSLNDVNHTDEKKASTNPSNFNIDSNNLNLSINPTASQAISSDVCLLRTLQTFDVLTNHHNDPSMNGDDGDDGDDGDGNVSPPTSHSQHTIDINTDEYSTAVSPPSTTDEQKEVSQNKPQMGSILQFPKINSGLNLSTWTQCFLDDIITYTHTLEYLSIITKQQQQQQQQQQQLGSEKSTQPQLPGNLTPQLLPVIPIGQVLIALNNKLKISKCRLHEPLNYITFHITTLIPQFIRALCTTSLRGRCDTVFNVFTLPEIDHSNPSIQADTQSHEDQSDSTLTSSHDDEIKPIIWYIDGAHTPESIAACAQWYKKRISCEPIYLTIQAERELLLNSSACEGISPNIKNEPNIGNQNNLIDVSSSHNNSNFRPLQQKLLLFNCGHTRSPFILFSPIITTFFKQQLFFDFIQQVKLLNSNFGQKNQQHQQHQQHQPNLPLSINLPFFEHVFLCPFDIDKPTNVPLPSLGELFQQYFSLDIDESKQQPGQNGCSNSIPTPQSSNEFSQIEEIIHNGRFQTSPDLETPYKTFIWQFQTMVIFDYLIQAELGLNTNLSEQHSPFFLQNQPTLFTLKSLNKSSLITNTKGNIDPYHFYSDISYSTSSHRTPYSPNAQNDHQGGKSEQLSPLFPPNELLNAIQFHPPIATLSRQIQLVIPNDGQPERFIPRKTICYHVMPSSYDAVMAIQYLSLQHQNQFRALNIESISSEQRSNTDAENCLVDKHVGLHDADTTSRVLVAGSLYLAGNTLQYLKCKI